VYTYEDMKSNVINYNDWQHDALSLNDSCKSIACRRDIEPDAANVYPSGGVDAKISSVLRAKTTAQSIHTLTPTRTHTQPLVEMRTGPTTNNGQPVFCWSKFEAEEGISFAHYGQPDCFDYDYVFV